MNKILLFILYSLFIQSGMYAEAPRPKAILQAHLHAASTNPSDIKTMKIHPGSTVTLQAEIKNVGNLPSAPGKVYIRFVLIEPLEDLLQSRTFHTESILLPSLYPGQVTVVKFMKEHQWPSLQDFIKQNWNMRHYQAVVKIDGEKEEKVIGYLPIFFSAYYYEGHHREVPREVKAR
ncbi:hypothetical protein DB41_DS00020 [Neochlamydia sp. TUME1]|uniref:hypothetical protein n=1 Tax=Neochlamydia sp. TUME1 TaxID=1478174 RepID=UPI00057EFC31|nr:hypothetical protein [Neochlamydia sp. TUME1]KIC76921.1 hypothetical protein DB41_DS00020 [Neochlamydia sp. TUME1]